MLDPKRPTMKYIIIKMTRLKDKERILKAAREKQVVIYKGVPIRLSFDFSTETFQARREWSELFKVLKSKDLHQGYFTQQGYHLKWKEIKSYPRQEKAKGVCYHQTSTTTNVKGLTLRRRKRERKSTEGNSLTIKWY